MKSEDPTKPRGAWEIRRPIRLSAGDAEAAQRLLLGLEGVLAAVAVPGRHRMLVRYDATRTDYSSIIAALEAAGHAHRRGWWVRLREGWYGYVDTVARDNAKIPAGPCCNKPPR
ncbi:MAG: heavy-metal-associated domain-containing protein [Gammaproteobacteria bacterium]|nr:heavy-metal-associated domain-containing protein [Gammaproteobacteria bacterium]MBU1654380.1 heavy-metal-associated domain-containing protein [Gammaproteobacteria bacterium]MBU1960221.1 heavy-metal-associated domain-containing protein [Gammaproteobacteria bacterium]